MLALKCGPCTALVTVVPHMTLFFSPAVCAIVFTYNRIGKKFESSTLGACSRSKRCYFGEGLRGIVQLVVRGECLTENDSTAYDCSFA